MSPWDTPSMNRLSEATGIHVSTISRIVKGQNVKGPTKDVVTQLAEALGKPAREVGGWIDAAWAQLEPYTPPAAADLMTNEQRAAVDSIIRAFATANRAAADSARLSDELAVAMAKKPGMRAQSKRT
ncbi:helix-turn-helix domain-containing protein [Williamsia sp. MIQD14]|uniref:helix-turn-helix domain-containing protein n=1 Tax=Williamsia sp. MIQD14 TaxID=3425703 RepID=UPI003DA0D4E8